MKMSAKPLEGNDMKTMKLPKLLRNERGFSLAFTFLIAIILVLLVWIIPSYLKIQSSAEQKSTRGALENLRKAVNLFYLQRGHYPYSLEDLEPNYVHPFPNVRLGIPGYRVNKQVTRVMVDSGMWYYDESSGEVKIDCNARDKEGNVIKDW
jgi:competence protein ComGC